MTQNLLDATLQSPTLINDWFARWLITASEDRSQVRLQVTEHQDDGMIIELQDATGDALGGIVFVSGRGAIHVLAANDPQNKPHTKRRTVEEMAESLEIGLDQASYREWCVSFYESCLYGGLPLLGLLVLYLLYYLFLF